MKLDWTPEVGERDSGKCFGCVSITGNDIEGKEESDATAERG